MSMSLSDLNHRFGTEEACRAFLVKLRFPNGVSCVRCGAEKVSPVKGRWAWQCRQCSPNGYRFSPLVGTIFENTNYPLVTWFQVIFLMCQSKKGMSALQIHRTIKSGSYRTAWYMCHRIRAAMESDDFKKLMGVVEVDETYVGGRPENRHRSERKRRAGRRMKVPVVAAISRKGKVVAKVIEHADIPTLDGFVNEVVSEDVSLIATDEHWGYSKLGRKFPHETVKHRAGEYARGVVHTANLDSFWALLKRGIVGNYHQVSRKYLPFYLAEFTFRHNNRKSPDLFEAVVKAC
jgi:ISXO2-like transposase domain/Transposase zinc-ribbon domain